jgi:hypothetical protein
MGGYWRCAGRFSRYRVTAEGVGIFWRCGIARGGCQACMGSSTNRDDGTYMVQSRLQT